MKSQTSKLIISVRSYAAEKCQTTEMSCFEVFHCKKMQPKAKDAKKKARKREGKVKKVGGAVKEGEESAKHFYHHHLHFQDEHPHQRQLHQCGFYFSPSGEHATTSNSQKEKETQKKTL